MKVVKSSRGPSLDDSACLQCSGSHHRMSRVRCPGSWWHQRNTGTVLYGPQETCPPVPAGGGGIWVGRGDPWGTKTRGQTKVTYLVSSSVTPLWDTGRGDAGIRQNESLESNGNIETRETRNDVQEPTNTNWMDKTINIQTITRLLTRHTWTKLHNEWESETG